MNAAREFIRACNQGENRVFPPDNPHRVRLHFFYASHIEVKWVYYQANRALPVFEELASILRKTSGVVEVLANALAPLANKIEAAFVFGSVGRGSESLGSDVDVLIIGEIGFAEAVQALYAAQDIVRREINPKVYQLGEWKILVDKKDAFVLEILNNPMLNIMGHFNDIK